MFKSSACLLARRFCMVINCRLPYEALASGLTKTGPALTTLNLRRFSSSSKIAGTCARSKDAGL